MDPAHASRRHRVIATVKWLWLSGIADLALAVLATYVAIRAVNAPLNAMGATGTKVTRLEVFDDPAGFLIVWVLLSLILVVTRQRFTVLALFAGLTVVTFVALRTKLEVLQAPLLPADLAFVGDLEFLGSQTSTATIVLPLAAGLLALAVAVWLDHRRRRSLALTDVTRRRRRIVSLALTPVLLLSFAHVLDFNRGGSLARAAYGEDPVLCCGWSQRESFLEAGFVAGFLANLPTELMEAPEGYSRAAIEEIAARYSEDLPDPDEGVSLADVNVVTVLSESFADPARLEGLELSRDPLAAFRELTPAGWSGRTISAAYGSGTSAMEFQVLTGQTMSFVAPQIISPFHATVSSAESFPSAVGWLRQHGFSATAIHAFHGEFYKRRDAYPALGYEQFIEESDFTTREHVGRNPLLSDSSIFAEALEVLTNAEGPAHVHLVTMQNHAPFSDWYDDPPEVDGLVGTPEEAAKLSTWVAGLEQSSLALADFLESVEGLDRPTLVVYYGDHYPAVLPDELITANTSTEVRTTPVLLWASEDVRQPGLDLGTTGAYDLLPLASEMLGTRLPPFYRLLQHVRDEVGVVAPGRIIAPDGTERTEDELNPEEQQLLDDYRLVQYDLSVGRGYGTDALWYDWAP